MKKYIGLTATIVLVVIACIISDEDERYSFIVVAIFIGIVMHFIITHIIIYGIVAKNKKYTIDSVAVTIFISFIFWMVVQIDSFISIDIRDYFAKEHSLEYQLYKSYTFDSSLIRETVNIEEDEPFTGYFQVPIRKLYRDSFIKEYKLLFWDEELEAFASSDEDIVILTFGRELKAVKYKYLAYYNDGVASSAKIFFDEEYRDDVVHVYITKTGLYFFATEFYVTDEDDKVVLVDDRMLYRT